MFNRNHVILIHVPYFLSLQDVGYDHDTVDTGILLSYIYSMLGLLYVTNNCIKLINSMEVICHLVQVETEQSNGTVFHRPGFESWLRYMFLTSTKVASSCSAPFQVAQL